MCALSYDACRNDRLTKRLAALRTQKMKILSVEVGVGYNLFKNDQLPSFEIEDFSIGSENKIHLFTKLKPSYTAIYSHKIRLCIFKMIVCVIAPTFVVTIFPRK